MDLHTFASLVQDMRREQIKYFKMRGQGAEAQSVQLQKSKELERKVDKYTDRILNPMLF